VRAPPSLGEHTDGVLQGWLGKSREEIDDLRRHGVI
jgi:crotonobetainyl-CoA:carnitine CoA-transferase CaiB-like acyl-CoA transferase